MTKEAEMDASSESCRERVCPWAKEIVAIRVNYLTFKIFIFLYRKLFQDNTSEDFWKTIDLLFLPFNLTFDYITLGNIKQNHMAYGQVHSIVFDKDERNYIKL